MKDAKRRRTRRSYSPAVRERVPEWFAREPLWGCGTQSLDYYQADPRAVHILGSLAPQTGDSLFVSFTGDWSWADGACIVERLLSRTWSSQFPQGVKVAVLYAVGNHVFPSPYVFRPSALLCAPETDSPDYQRDAPQLIADPCMPRDWLEQVDWQPCATVSGLEFMEKGFAAFYPELIEW